MRRGFAVAINCKAANGKKREAFIKTVGQIHLQVGNCQCGCALVETGKC